MSTRYWSVSSLVLTLFLASSCEQFLEPVEVAEPTTEVDPGLPQAGSTGDGPPTYPISRPSDPTVIVPEECPVGSLRCNQASLQVCVRLEGEIPSAWVLQQDCLTPDLCVPEPTSHCVTRECDASEVDCQGATPVVCNAAQNGWEALDACESAAHCSTNGSDCAGDAPCCLAAPCEAGQLRCSANELQRCNSDQTDWEPEQACASSELCQGGLADCETVGGACLCRDALCAVGDTRCSGTNLERCNVGQSGWDVVDTCASEELCALGQALSPERCELPACEAGSFSCTETGVLEICRDDLTDFDFQDDCEGSQFCNATDGRCEEIPCLAGEEQCNGAQIQECRDDRTQFDNTGDVCATPQLCNSDNAGGFECDEPRCFVNQFDCFGTNQLFRCNNGRTDFEPVGQTCLRPELCSPQRRRCDFCFLGRTECTPENDASRTCSASGDFFGPETFCPLGCIPETGLCRTCQFGSYQCQGNNLTRCNDGFSFSPLNRNADCSNQQQRVVCNNGQPQTQFCANGCNAFANACNECSGQQRRCVGSNFQQCNGGFFGGTQSCGGGLTCRGQGQCGCNPFELRCAGGTLQECNFQGTAFGNAARCNGAVLRSCQQGTPVQENCGSALACSQAVGNSCPIVEEPIEEPIEEPVEEPVEEEDEE